jgi:peptidoglycan/xylan/chitin deacetylase (PgdA/CDA1 family)
VRSPKYWLKDAGYGTLFLLTGLSAGRIRAILRYHSVGDQPWAVPLKALQEQMAYLKSNSQVVLLRDFERHADSSGSRALVAVTFDDGALDNYTEALPVLERLDLKATFFVITNCIGGQHNGTFYQTPVMNRAQVRELALLGHEIGAHTVNHPDLTGLDREHVLSEMCDCKRHLEDLTQASVASFAYPFGSFNHAIRSCAQEAGFQFATTSCEALVPEKDVDWWALPRVGVDSSMSIAQFRGKVSPALELYERLRGRRRPGNGLSRDKH